MNKSDLNSSMLFKFRNGVLYTLLYDFDGEYIFYDKIDIEEGYSGDGILLNDYSNDLKYVGNKDYDIVAIKQRNGCVRVISDILNDQEPDEWDWVEEVEKKPEKQVIHNHNYTINLTIDSNTDIDKIMCQLENQIRKLGFNRLVV